MKSKFVTIVCIMVMPLLFTGCVEWYMHKRIGHTRFHIVESDAHNAAGKSLPFLGYKTIMGDGYIVVHLGDYPLDVRWNKQYILVRCFDGNDSETVTRYYIIDQKTRLLGLGPSYELQGYDTEEDFRAAVATLGLDVQEMKYTDNHTPWHLPFF